MYRRYENPWKLQEQLEEARPRLEEARNDPDYEPADMIWLYEDVISLEERVNFAWQDDEYEEDYVRENYPEMYMDGSWRDMDNDPWDDEPRSDVGDEEE